MGDAKSDVKVAKSELANSIVNADNSAKIGKNLCNYPAHCVSKVEVYLEKQAVDLKNCVFVGKSAIFWKTHARSMLSISFRPIR
jgi:hypothetical protein